MAVVRPRLTASVGLKIIIVVVVVIIIIIILLVFVIININMTNGISQMQVCYGESCSNSSFFSCSR